MVQVFFVMLFFPVVMNALQYYIIDSFIKNQKPNDHEPIPDEDEDDLDHDGRRRGRSIDVVSDSESEDESEVAKKASVTKASKQGEDDTESKKEPKILDEYDPNIDGSRSVGSSSGEQENPPPPPPKDLKRTATGN